MLPDLEWVPDFIESDKADRLYRDIQRTTPWQQLPITLFGKTHLQPRLIHYEGEVAYTYSRLTLPPQPFSDHIAELKELIKDHTGIQFNSALVNYYRDGMDYMGWHADDEPELGENPIIASVSLGAERPMNFRLKTSHKIKYEQWLSKGGLLIMKGYTQHLWEHSLPKRKRIEEGRINITFRQIKA